MRFNRLFILVLVVFTLFVYPTEKIEEIIFNLSNSKKTIILSTHNLSQARYFGKRIYFLRNGELIEKGNSEGIFNGCAKMLNESYGI